MYLEGTKIDCISDTHNRHKHFTMPGGDILIHSGDYSLGGTTGETSRFLDWYADQDYSHLILVAGNHDWLAEKQPALFAEECSNRGIILLNDSDYEAGGIKIWGSPIQPWFHNWAFNRWPGEDIEKHWDLIPDDTEILITHGPAWGILDFIPFQNKGVGCPSMLHTIETRLKKLKLHVFGHIHEGAGYTYKNGRTHVNASVLDGQYQPLSGKPIRIVKDIAGDYLAEQD